MRLSAQGVSAAVTATSLLSGVSEDCPLLVVWCQHRMDVVAIATLGCLPGSIEPGLEATDIPSLCLERQRSVLFEGETHLEENTTRLLS